MPPKIQWFEKKSYLTVRGKYKVAQWLMQHGEALTSDELKVATFIFNMTIAWDNSFEAVSYSDFRRGVRRRNGKQKCLPIGLQMSALKSAINLLVNKGVIFRHQVGTRPFYQLNTDWRASSDLETWELEESDYACPSE